jgi:hypothetical protein
MVDPTISSAYAVHRGEMALDDWIEFDVAHDGGRYALALEYAAESPRPLSVRLNGVVLAEPVAAQTTGSWDTLCTFDETVLLDFGEDAGTATLAFRPHDGYIPHMKSGILRRAQDSSRAHDARTVQEGVDGVCVDIVAVFAELISDKETVDTCKTMLETIHAKGVRVDDAFGPLNAQSVNIQCTIDSFAERFRVGYGALASLLADMRTEAANVGPL